MKVHDARGNDSIAYFDRLGRVVRQVDAEGYVTDTAYTLGGQVAKVTRQASANLWPSPADGSAWTVTGATRASSGTIDGNPASSITVSAGGTPGYFSAAGTTVVDGDTIELSLWAKKGTVDFASFGILAGSSDWGSNGDSTATVVSGPGTLTQVGGGLWQVSGLDTGQATLVTVTRTFHGSATIAGRVYAGSST